MKVYRLNLSSYCLPLITVTTNYCSFALYAYFSTIHFRNLFSWFSFILFFYNGLAGFVGAVFRIAMSAVLSLILLFRLDEVALMKKFDSLDFGKLFVDSNECDITFEYIACMSIGQVLIVRVYRVQIVRFYGARHENMKRHVLRVMISPSH